jgi:hypothetical protein
MKARLSLTKIALVVLTLFGSLHTASAYYDPGVQRWINRDPIGVSGQRILRGACVGCYAPFGREAATYRFCDNIPTVEYDSFGLLTLQDCDDQYDKDMAAADAAVKKCIASGVKWGIAGVIVLGGGGALFANIGGFFIGTGATAIIDGCHIAHCMGKANKMKYDAAVSWTNCVNHVNQ